MPGVTAGPSSDSHEGNGPLVRLPKETRKRSAPVTTRNDTRHKRRTVPNELRKRCAISCDLCKTRRVKCVRSAASPQSGDTLPPCDNCTKLDVPCRSILPRKTRIYGSVQSLSARYRILDALVKGLLPGRETDDTENLVKIANELNIPVPEVDLTNGSSSSPGLPENEPSISNAVTAPDNSPPPVVSLPQAPGAPTVIADHYPSPSQGFRSDEPVLQRILVQYGNPFQDAQADPTQLRKMSVLRKENLYPDSEGKMSYLGPSSSFRFIIGVRKMLAESTKTTPAKEYFWTSHGSTASENDGQENVAHMQKQPTGRTNTTQSSHNSSPSSSREVTSPVTGPQDSSNQSSTPENSVTVNHNIGVQQPRERDIVYKMTDLLELAKESLPSRAMGDALVEAFFDKVHVNYIIFHRGMFQMMYESLFASLEGDTSESLAHQMDVGWVCCIYMVFVFGAQALEDCDHQRSLLVQQRYFKLVHSLVAQVFNTTSLSNIQAILLIQLYQHNSGERNASWMLLGCACRMAIAMGMHRGGVTEGCDPIIRELRRRVWWTMFMFEQQLSLTLGRPSAFPEDAEVTVGLPNEGMMDGKTYMPPGLLENLVRLSHIYVSMRRGLVAAADIVSRNSDMADKSEATILRLSPESTRQHLQKLEEWFRNLPPNHQLDWNAKGSNHYRAAHLLHLLYYHAKQVLTRSYLLEKLEAQLAVSEPSASEEQRFTHSLESNSEKDEFSSICLSAAHSSINIIQRLNDSRQLDGVAWLDLYYAYHSLVMVLISLLPERTKLEMLSSGNNADTVRLSPEVKQRRDIVAKLLEIMLEVKVCKTMRVFVNVTVRLANIIGIGILHHDHHPPSGILMSTAGRQQIPPTPQPPQRPSGGFTPVASQHNFPVPSAYDWFRSLDDDIFTEAPFNNQNGNIDGFAYDPSRPTGFVPMDQTMLTGTMMATLGGGSGVYATTAPTFSPPPNSGNQVDGFNNIAASLWAES